MKHGIIIMIIIIKTLWWSFITAMVAVFVYEYREDRKVNEISMKSSGGIFYNTRKSRFNFKYGCETQIFWKLMHGLLYPVTNQCSFLHGSLQRSLNLCVCLTVCLSSCVYIVNVIGILLGSVS